MYSKWAAAYNDKTDIQLNYQAIGSGGGIKQIKAKRNAALWDEVKDKLSQNGSALSSGQQQRLCIARAVAVQPNVLLLNEPASALDPVATLKIEELIHELREEYTIIVVTHNMQQVARVAGYTAFFQTHRFMMEDPRTIRHMLDVMWAVKALERIGDHSTTIGEYVVYFVGGKDVRHIGVEELEKHVRLRR